MEEQSRLRSLDLPTQVTVQLLHRRAFVNPEEALQIFKHLYDLFEALRPRGGAFRKARDFMAQPLRILAALLDLREHADRLNQQFPALKQLQLCTPNKLKCSSRLPLPPEPAPDAVESLSDALESFFTARGSPHDSRTHLSGAQRTKLR